MPRISILLIIYLVEISISEVLSQPTLNMFTLNNNYYCALTNDTSSSALSWSHQNKGSHPSNKLFCDMESTCQAFNTHSTVKWIDDLDIAPILDFRWEGIIGVELELHPPTLVYEPKQDSFRISFSFKGIEIHILLCDRKFDIEYGNCYWLGFGANKGTRNFLRICAEGKIPFKPGKYAHPPCSNYTRLINEKNIIREDIWNHLSVYKKGNLLEVYLENRPGVWLEYNDTSADRIAVSHVIVRSGVTQKAFMKVHTVRVLPLPLHSAAPTTIALKSSRASSCIALYLRTCRNCGVNITLALHPNVILQRQNEEVDGWQRIIFRDKENSIGTNSTISIISTQSGSGTSNISSTIENCEVISVKNASGDAECCHALKYPELRICLNDTLQHNVENEVLNCPRDTIGGNCLPCTTFDANNCANSKLCYTNSSRISKCYCAPGYYGFNCELRCFAGTYGHNCKQKCGKCAYNACDSVDGYCTSCQENFIGQTCNEAKLPIVKKAPAIINEQHRAIEVDLDLSFDGKENPQYYTVQYKEENQTNWQSTSKMRYSKAAQLKLTKLTSNMHYQIRVILLTNKNEGYYGNHTPVVGARTTCRADIRELMKVKAHNISMIITIQSNRSKEICPLTELQLCIYENRINKSCSQDLHFSTTFSNLEPYHEYMLILYRNGSKIQEWTERTAEGVPEQVQNFQRGKASNTSIELIWDEPQKKNGNIRGYIIKYRHTKWKGCRTLDSKMNTTMLRVLETKVHLNSLLPYSSYVVNIWAFTVYDGLATETSIETSETTIPTKEEFPSTTFVRSTSRSLLVGLHWNCSRIKGEFRFRAELICNSAWCINETQTVVEDIIEAEELLSIKMPVYGYTNYTLRMFMDRKGVIFPKDEVIITKASEPGPVRNATIYSKTNTSVSIRWLPPYPPMGKLCLYEVKTNLNNSKKYEVSRTSDCELWPGHICTTISNLPSNVRVRIRIKAQNINVPGLGNETDVSAEVIEEVSEPPQYIKFEWDNEYGLTLFWPHPDITNGPLQQFLITINEKEYLYNVSKEEAQYTYKLNLPEELTSQTITVGVKAKNSAGISQLTNSSTYTPPKVPKFKKLPSIEMKTNTTITVNIPSVSNVEGDTSNMYIVITNLNRNEKIRRQYLNPLEQQLLQDVNISVTDSWVASAFNLNDSAKQNGFLFEVGSNTENPSSINKEWKLEHRKLNMENAYMITFVLNNTFKEFTRLGVYPLQSSAPPKPTDNNSLFYLLLLLIPIILCVLCVLVIRRNQDKVTSSIYVSFQKLGLSRPSTEVPLTPLPREDKISVPQSSVTKPAVPVINKKSDGSSTEIEKYSNLVKICDLNDYIRKCIENGEFEKQHGMFQRGQTKPWICGTKPQNKSKNRYINLSAYDHTRVKLEIINQDPYSDYINANYIDGYKSKNTYIATQGPKVSTLNDFWRMIWQEKVEFIIMIANIVEGGKKKVEKYWPEINESKEFINIKVEYLSVDVMANYEIRHFIVSREGETRKIQQFHFLTWPDHGVPLYPQSLSPFLKKILTIPQGGAPVVVHCSAGVGRTGSLILCDICLRMAAREGKIDAFYYLNKIREQRVNMVDNVEQYKLVHLVLLQCLVAPETGVLCNETMENNIETILAAKIDEEMQYLDESAWQDEAMRNTNFSSDLPIIHSKNRFKSIIPEPASRICLTAYPSSDPSSIYINAVSVDAFAMPAKFVVTQNPLTSTVGDFWRLVEQKEITMIVCLNQLDFQEKTTCKFYPTSSAHSMKVVQYLEIKYSGKEVNAHFKVYSVTMSNLQTQEDVQIKIIHLNNWHHSAIHPDNPVGLLTTYEEMNHLGRNSDTILVTCHDGAKACGLYVAMCFIVDKIKMEQICDVCLAVRTVRHSRKEFVRNAEQYAFLYKCALEYVRQFEMYSNFRASK